MIPFILTSIIILWITVVLLILETRELNKILNRYNKRIYENFALAYDTKLDVANLNIDERLGNLYLQIKEVEYKIKSINEYLDKKAEEDVHNSWIPRASHQYKNTSGISTHKSPELTFYPSDCEDK